MKPSRLQAALSKTKPAPGMPAPNGGMGHAPTLKKSKLYNKLKELQDPINK